MKITDKYIIEVYGFFEQAWWNGSKPFVFDINKAFVCPHKKSAEIIKKRIDNIYGCECRIVPLEIKA